MPQGRAAGLAVLCLGLIVLGVGATVFFVVPSWGAWVRDYPNSVLAQPLPQEVAPLARALLQTVFGPLLRQIGNYIRSAGYFIGSLLMLVSLFPIGMGTRLIWQRR